MSLTSVPKGIQELRNQQIDPFVSDLLEIRDDSSLSKIVGLLTDRHAFEVFIPEDGRCGMILTRDVLKAMKTENTKASLLMSFVPVLRKEATVAEAARLMADYRIRAVPISDGRRVVGQVTSSSLLDQLKGKISGEPRITSIASRNPVVIEETDTIAKARDIMVRKRIDHLPVTRAGRVSGIVTSADIVSRIVPPERIGKKSLEPEVRRTMNFPVGDSMNPNPLTCPPETTVLQALNLMLNAAQTCVLVTQWEELHGIVTHRDFMNLLVEPEEEIDVPIFMIGLPDDPFEAEATKAKFRRTINQLHKLFPDILEARSVIKTKFTKPDKERGRYEVTVRIRTPHDSYTYSEGGWELPAIYDVITDRLKRLMTQKRIRRRERERERSE
jgi:CBS domain-containing protein